MFFASIVIAVAALAAALVMHACASGRIPVNNLVGIRLPSVMASTGAWRAGHKAAIPPTWVSAVVCVLLAGISLSPSLPNGAESGLMVTATLVLLAAVIVSSMLARRAALAQLATEQREHHR